MLGNLMTGYNYRHVNLRISEIGPETRVETSLGDGRKTLDLTIDDRAQNADLPAGSPFADWRTARRFAGPMPFTFSPEADGSFVVIEGSRSDWVPRPVLVKHWEVGLVQAVEVAGGCGAPQPGECIHFPRPYVFHLSGARDDGPAKSVTRLSPDECPIPHQQDECGIESHHPERGNQNLDGMSVKKSGFPAAPEREFRATLRVHGDCIFRKTDLVPSS